MSYDRHLSRMSARVERGAALLDAEVPDWASRVDLDRLDVSRQCDCPLGQVYGDFDLGTIFLGLWPWEVSRHGFKPTVLSHIVGAKMRDYHALNLLWANEILVRRRADARRLVAPPKVHAPVLV